MPPQPRCAVTSSQLWDRHTAEGAVVTAVTAVPDTTLVAVAHGPCPVLFPPSSGAVAGRTTISIAAATKPQAGAKRAQRVLPVALQTAADEAALSLSTADAGLVWSLAAAPRVGTAPPVVFAALPHARAVACVSGQDAAVHRFLAHDVEPLCVAVAPRAPPHVPGPPNTHEPRARPQYIAVGTVGAGVLLAVASLTARQGGGAALHMTVLRALGHGGAAGEYPVAHVAFAAADSSALGWRVAATSWANPALLLWDAVDAAPLDASHRVPVSTQSAVATQPWGVGAVFYTTGTGFSQAGRKATPCAGSTAIAAARCAGTPPAVLRRSGVTDAAPCVVAVGTARGEAVVFFGWGAHMVRVATLDLRRGAPAEGAAVRQLGIAVDPSPATSGNGAAFDVALVAHHADGRCVLGRLTLTSAFAAYRKRARSLTSSTATSTATSTGSSGEEDSSDDSDVALLL